MISFVFKHKGIFITIIVLVTLVFSILSQFSIADLVRYTKNADLEKEGITVSFNYTAKGMYKEPFIIKFGNIVYRLSKRKIMLNMYNCYTVGNMDNVEGRSIPSVSSMLDPTSKFKDSWFGVFIIKDDRGFSRKFVLKDPSGYPDNPHNINAESLLLLPMYDQMVVVLSTHQNQRNYSYKKFMNEFVFKMKTDTGIEQNIIKDTKGREWCRIFSEFETVSALTDIKKTDMKLFSSIRSYVGLPENEVYEYVSPWHPITIKGLVFARYFRCKKMGFWAIVYYNGTAFIDKKGNKVDTWEQRDIQQEFYKMFENIEISCLR